MRTLFVLALAGCPGPELDDESLQTSQLIEQDALMDRLNTLEDIAADNGGTRVFTSQGYLDSVDYVATTLEDAGYDVTIEEFPIRAFRVDGVDVSVVGQAPPELQSINAEVFAFSGSATVTASFTLVDVQIPPTGAANSSTSGCESADFAGFPTGNIAVLQRGTCTFNDKVVNAQQAGASAVVVFNEGQQGRRDVVIGQLDADVATVPVVGVAYEVGRALADASGRQLTVSVDASIEVTTDRNVFAETTGGDPARTLLIGAHLDSVVAGAGINDNGSGSAFVLELAVQLAETGFEPNNRMQFAWWGAEEEGLLGSQAYFFDELGAPNDAVLSTLDAYLNFDMLASGNGVRMVYDGDGSDFDDGVDSDGSADIEDLFHAYFDELDLPTRAEALLIASDSYWPAVLGVPTGGLFSGAFSVKSESEEDLYGGDAGTALDPCYHLACDTVDNTNPVLFTELARAGAAVATQLAMRDEPLSRATRRRARADLPIPRGCHEQVAWDR